MKAENLTVCAKSHNTDKLKRGYVPFYEKYLDRNIGSLCEIGVYKGGSLFMWADYLDKTNILGIDIECDNQEEIERYDSRIKVKQGSVLDSDFMDSVKDIFDVIIDDGGHTMIQQQTTLSRMFRNNLKTGGLYVVEDLITSTRAYTNWWGDVREDKDTTLCALKRFIGGGSLETMYLSSDDNEYFKKNISHIQIYYGTNGGIICFIRKV